MLNEEEDAELAVEEKRVEGKLPVDDMMALHVDGLIELGAGYAQSEAGRSLRELLLLYTRTMWQVYKHHASKGLTAAQLGLSEFQQLVVEMQLPNAIKHGKQLTMGEVGTIFSEVNGRVQEAGHKADMLGLDFGEFQAAIIKCVLDVHGADDLPGSFDRTIIESMTITACRASRSDCFGFASRIDSRNLREIFAAKRGMLKKLYLRHAKADALDFDNTSL
eukprot:SAG22_NODE_1229_length_5081_cov_2.651947_6_plen_220_part_00